MPSITRSAVGARDARRDDVQRKLFRVTENLLNEGYGFTEISVERLITAADVSRSTFYVYFADKGELLAGLTASAMGELLDALGKWFELSADIDRGALRDVMSGIAQTYHEHGPLMGAVVEAATYDERIREAFEQVVGAAIDGIEGVIRRGQEAGTIRPEIDPRAIAETLTWATERCLYQLVRSADQAERRRRIDALTTMTWNTLYIDA